MARDAARLLGWEGEIPCLPEFLLPFARFGLSLVSGEGGAVSQAERLAGLRLFGVPEEDWWLWVALADQVIAARIGELLRRRRQAEEDASEKRNLAARRGGYVPGLRRRRR